MFRKVWSYFLRHNNLERGWGGREEKKREGENTER